MYVDAGEVSVTITGTTGGDFEKVEVDPAAAVTEVTDTIDTSTVTLTATPSVTEGGVVTYTASVTAPVTGSALVINLANGQQITILWVPARVPWTSLHRTTCTPPTRI
nr:hypothetical protein [Pseudomonas sp. BIGb0427]